MISYLFSIVNMPLS